MLAVETARLPLLRETAVRTTPSVRATGSAKTARVWTPTAPTEAGSGGAAAGAGGSSAGNAAYSGKPPVAGANGVIDDPELEQACSRDCEARLAAGCSMNVGSLDQCLAQCLVVDESSQGYCLDEMTDRYSCSASGGYTCVSGYAQPRSTCLAEPTALSKCSQMTPCKCSATGSRANAATQVPTASASARNDKPSSRMQSATSTTLNCSAVGLAV